MLALYSLAMATSGYSYLVAILHGIEHALVHIGHVGHIDDIRACWVQMH